MYTTHKSCPVAFENGWLGDCENIFQDQIALFHFIAYMTFKARFHSTAAFMTHNITMIRLYWGLSHIVHSCFDWNHSTIITDNLLYFRICIHSSMEACLILILWMFNFMLSISLIYLDLKSKRSCVLPRRKNRKKHPKKQQKTMQLNKSLPVNEVRRDAKMWTWKKTTKNCLHLVNWKQREKKKLKD